MVNSVPWPARITDLRKTWPPWRNKRPVAVIFRPGSAGLEPFHQHGTITGPQFAGGVRRRHSIVRIPGIQPLEHLTVRKNSRLEGGRSVPQVQLCLARLDIRPMAIVAGIGEDRPNVTAEIELLCHCRKRQKGRKDDGKRNRKQMLFLAENHLHARILAETYPSPDFNFPSFRFQQTGECQSPVRKESPSPLFREHQ